MDQMATAQAGGNPIAAAFGAYLAAVGSNGVLDFENNFRGQRNAGYLGQAGNFAHGVASGYLFGSGSFGQYGAMSGAGFYATMAGKQGRGIPFLTAAYGAGPSAPQNVPSGVASTCGWF